MAKLRTWLLVIAAIAVLLGGYQILHRRAFCQKQARDFAFWKDMNRGRVAPLEEASKTSPDRVRAESWGNEAARARAEADRCAMVEELYRVAAGRPWSALPTSPEPPEYAPYRSP